MKQNVIILVIFSLFIVSEVGYSKNKEKYVDCHINKHWWDRKAGIGSGNYYLGKYRSVVVEEMTNTWNFMDEQTQVEVKANIKYYHTTFDDKKSPVNIEISLNVIDVKDSNLINSCASIADTRYNKHFQELGVYKKVLINNLEYTYSMGCQRVK